MPEQTITPQVTQQTEVVKKDNRKRNIIIAVIIVLVLLVIIIAAFLFASRNNNPGYGYSNESTTTSSTQSSRTSTQTSSASSTTTSTVTSAAADTYVNTGTNNTWKYTSTEYGITFTVVNPYPDTPTPVNVTREGNKIWVYVGTDKNGGQSVELFTKPANQTFKQAIEEDFLASYDPAKCFVETTTRADGLVSAQIKYPVSESTDSPWWENAQYCPTNYSATNGVRYFLYDQNKPTQYAFFNIGQYAIYGTADGDWASTFVFVK